MNIKINERRNIAKLSVHSLPKSVFCGSKNQISFPLTRKHVSKNEDLSADLRVFKCNTVLITLPVAKIVLRCPQKSE